MKHRLAPIVLASAAAGAAVMVWALGSAVPQKPRIETSGTAAIGGPYTLVATDGHEVTDRTYVGKWPLIYFGYTSCPDACPTALNNLSVALEKLGRDADKVQPLFVTIDPQRDTADVLAEYLRSFDPRILGLTGTQAQVDRIVREYRVYVARRSRGGSGDEDVVSHSGYLYLMKPRGTFVNVIQGSAAGEEIAAWLRKEMTRSAS